MEAKNPTKVFEELQDWISYLKFDFEVSSQQVKYKEQSKRIRDTLLRLINVSAKQVEKHNIRFK